MADPDNPPAPDAPDSGAARANAEAVADVVRRMLAAMPARESVTSDEVEQAIRAYSRAARAAGTPPERLLVAVAAIIAGATPPGTSDWWRAVVRDRLILWAIEGYYQIDIERRPDPGPRAQPDG